MSRHLFPWKVRPLIRGFPPTWRKERTPVQALPAVLQGTSSCAPDCGARLMTETGAANRVGGAFSISWGPPRLADNPTFQQRTRIFVRGSWARARTFLFLGVVTVFVTIGGQFEKTSETQPPRKAHETKGFQPLVVSQRFPKLDYESAADPQFINPDEAVCTSWRASTGPLAVAPVGDFLERDGYENGYNRQKRRAKIFVSALLTALESMVRRGGLEPPRDCSR